MKRFLYLDNWHEPQPETRFDRYLKDSGLDVEVFRTNQDAFPQHTAYGGAYLSPSFDGAYDDLAWINRLHDLLPRLAAAKVPMIGQCFGCQVLASALVGRETVFKRDNHEGGRGTIFLTAAGANDPLTRALTGGIGTSFDVYHWHGDEVKADNSDIIVLADGPGCGNHLWRWSKGPVWGIQPHPEMNAADLQVWLAQNRDRFERKGHDVDNYVSQCFSADTAFEMMTRFVALVKSGNVTAETFVPQKSYSK